MSLIFTGDLTQGLKMECMYILHIYICYLNQGQEMQVYVWGFFLQIKSSVQQVDKMRVKGACVL